MKYISTHRLPHILSGAIAVLLFGNAAESVQAATFNWVNITGNFSAAANWGGTVPTGLDATDILVFGGDVGTTGLPTNYTATNDIAVNPFLLNKLLLQATTTTPGTGPVDTIVGAAALLFGGTNATITQNGTAAVVINEPITLGANLLLTGSPVVGADTAHDKANVTFNGTLSGNFDITKSGTSTFRFGSAGTAGIPDNTWFGTLTISDGTIRFNNNAYTAPTALRANPVVLNSATALLTTQFKQLSTALPTPSGFDPDSSLRLGTLSGSAGTVEARRETATANVFDSTDITITALSSGSFAGTLRNNQSGGGSTSGTLTLRGVGTQTFTGILDLAKDVRVGDIATMVIGGSASLGGQLSNAAIILGGGTLRLDNTAISNPNRLRDGATTSTGVETIGGGTLSLVSNALASVQETVSRLQLGSSGNSRSGAVTINVTQNAASGISSLTFQSYARDSAGNPYDTVNFTAKNGSGTTIPLGAATDGARVSFNFVVPTFNGLLGNTGANVTAVGWATVNGTDFAATGAQGIVPAITTPTTDAALLGTTTGSATLNAVLAGNLTLSNAGGYSVNSVKITPTAPGQAINLSTTGNLFTNAFLLAGTTDFTINSTGGGGIADAGGAAPRYFQVASAMLTVNASVGAAGGAIVKSGAGTLVLTNTSNIAVGSPVVINEGTLRVNPATTMPAGELRFRGGVLEITGGGTFSRQLGPGVNQLTWSGIDATVVPNVAINQEQGSGGFSAFGANATVDLSPTTGTDFTWEDNGFVNSGHALLFGSTRANAMLTWVDNIGLTAVGQVTNYNARQFRAIDNPSSTNDVAVLSGTISGSVRNDFLKTGNGELILSGTNTFAGATLITDGTLRVNGSTATSFLTDVRDTGTLGGAGTVAGVQVEGSGTLAPGDLTAHTSILNTANLKFASGSARLAIELGGTSPGGNGVSGYDRVSVTGSVTLGGAQLTGSLLSGFNAGIADLFFIIINDGTDAVQGAFAQGSLVAIGSQVFNISYAGNFTGSAATNSFTGGNDVVLQLAVPEPGTASLLALGAMGLGMRRRA